MICMETALFQKKFFFYNSTSQDKKLLLMLPFTRVSGCVCVSSLVYAFQYMRRLVRECSNLQPFVLFVCVDPLLPDQQF